MTRKVAAAVILASVTCGAAPSEAQLERAGPIAPTHGYPAWYQDKSGLALEFCQPSTPAELADGWCLLLPGDTSVPESFPAQFGDEHFYWAAQAAVDFTAAGVSGKVLLVLALEAAFAQGSPAAGDQIVFGRVRVNMRQVPYGGTYTIYHPYGVEVFPDMAAGDRLFFTEDIGFGCADGFECALLSRLGPFLLPADTPGGAELGAVAGPVPGKLYIAAPTRLGPVTGSPVGQNFFRVEGPNGFALQTNDFSLMGRVYNGAIPGKVIVDRVAYSSTDSVRKLDVFATAYPTAQSRLPAAPKPPAIMPVLAFYPEACVQTTSGALTEPPGVEGIQMVNAGSVFWGQAQPQTIPRAVCVEDYTARDITGQVVPIFVEAPVTDQVTITEAVYDPSLGTLSVKAVSSDSLQSPPLSVATFGAMQSGLLLATSVVAPPSKVHVISAAGGQAELAVSTGVGGPGAAGGVPLAANDEIALVEDSGPTSIPVLANDTLQGVPIQAGPNVSVVIVGPPRLGTAVVEADGSITFTPTPDANGLEGIAYIVSANGVSSPAAYITIIISPVNDAPVAVADAAQAVAGRSETINVLANDTDIDGQGDVASVVIKTQPTGASAAIGADGLVTFSAPAAGTYTFTYAALDLAGAESAAAAVTVSVVASEVLTIVRSEYIRTTFRWRVEGTDNVLAGQRVTITYDNGTFLDGSSALNTVIGTAVVDALGAWSLDLRLTSAADLRNPTATNTFSARPTRVRATSSLGATATASIVLR